MKVKDKAAFKDEILKRMTKEVEVQEKDLTKESIYETLLKLTPDFNFKYLDQGFPEMLKERKALINL